MMIPGTEPLDIKLTACSVLRTSTAVRPETIKATFEWCELPSCGFIDVTNAFQPSTVSTTMVLR